jgi:hypothetical protein
MAKLGVSDICLAYEICRQVHLMLRLVVDGRAIAIGLKMI